MTKIKKMIITIMLIFSLIGAPNHAHAAVMWGTLNIAGDAFKQVLEVIYTQIQEAIFAAAKIAAIKQATSTIEDSLYGDSSSPRNIKNFEEFLITKPQEKAVTYAQDFLTNSLRGTTSGDYKSSGGGSGNLSKAIEAAGKSVINNAKGKNSRTVNYSEHCSGDDYFAKGDFKCFNTIMSNSLNTPIGMALAVDQVTKAKYLQEKEIAELEGTSSGVLGQKDDDGNITNPSSVVEEIQLQQITLPLEALANGDNNAFSVMIQSFAVSLVTEIIEEGLGEVESSIDKNTDAFKKQFEKELDDLKKEAGPSSEYSNDSYSSSKKSTRSSNSSSTSGSSSSSTNSSTSTSNSSNTSGTGWTNPDTGTTF